MVVGGGADNHGVDQGDVMRNHEASRVEWKMSVGQKDQCSAAYIAARSLALNRSHPSNTSKHEQEANRRIVACMGIRPSWDMSVWA
jgi:hypothetical protein